MFNEGRCVDCDLQGRKIATFRVARLTLQAPKLWLVGVATDRDARHACLRFFSCYFSCFFCEHKRQSKKSTKNEKKQIQKKRKEKKEKKRKEKKRKEKKRKEKKKEASWGYTPSTETAQKYIYIYIDFHKKCQKKSCSN